MPIPRPSRTIRGVQDWRGRGSGWRNVCEDREGGDLHAIKSRVIHPENCRTAMKAWLLVLVSLHACESFVPPALRVVPGLRTSLITLEEEQESQESAPTPSSRYAAAEERGRSALDQMQADSAAEEARRRAKAELAADAEAMPPFNPLAAVAALGAGAVLGYLVQVNS